jgi:hypothetical protein
LYFTFFPFFQKFHCPKFLFRIKIPKIEQKKKKISFATSSLFFEQGGSEFPPKHGEGDRQKNRGQSVQVASAHHFPGRVLLKPEGKTSGKNGPRGSFLQMELLLALYL